MYIHLFVRGERRKSENLASWFFIYLLALPPKHLNVHLKPLLDKSIKAKCRIGHYLGVPYLHLKKFRLTW